jgi:transposase
VKPSADRMRKGLAAARTPEAQAAALGAYADTVSMAGDRVEAIAPPALLENAQLAEIARLGRTARAIRAVQRGLRAHDRVQLQQALTGLQSAVGITSTATRVAILSYNRHVAEIQRLGTKVEQERQRLNASL